MRERRGFRPPHPCSDSYDGRGVRGTAMTLPARLSSRLSSSGGSPASKRTASTVKEARPHLLTDPNDPTTRADRSRTYVLGSSPPQRGQGSLVSTTRWHALHCV
jgi:hypothetical protein